MRIGNTFFIALAIGGLWGAIYIVVFSVLAMLISGETIVPDIGVALLSGGNRCRCLRSWARSTSGMVLGNAVCGDCAGGLCVIKRIDVG